MQQCGSANEVPDQLEGAFGTRGTRQQYLGRLLTRSKADQGMSQGAASWQQTAFAICGQFFYFYSTVSAFGCTAHTHTHRATHLHLKWIMAITLSLWMQRWAAGGGRTGGLAALSVLTWKFVWMCVCQCATVAAKTVQIWKRGWRVSKQTGRRRRRKQQKQKTNLAERARMGFSNIWPSREA